MAEGARDERRVIGDELLHSDPMPQDLKHHAWRFETYAREVLAAAVYPIRAPLDVAVFQCGDAIPVGEAIRGDFVPVKPGWRWGPVWSTAWFRLTGLIPTAMAGRIVVARFSCGTEAQLWLDGVPHHGFDPNRDTVILQESTSGGEPVELFIEAACNLPLWATTFWWDERELHERWREDKPGRLERCEIATYEPTVWRLWRSFEFARLLMLQYGENNARGQELRDGLREAIRQIDPDDVTASASLAQPLIDELLGSGAATDATRCTAIGHAHIDTAWLWPIRETRRKCLRTFSNVLRLMERFPDFHFIASQPQQYAWVEQDAPALFDQIASRVREGRWEAAGAMWIEADCNLPSGESLVRQIIHGVRYYRERFGDDAPQRCLFLPDTFGFPASLPQIMRLAGIDTFITNKLAWNQSNPFPFVNFHWRGIDGTCVLSHLTPGHEYNAANDPEILQQGESNLKAKNEDRTDCWLQPFGYGDGGGGPTDWMILRSELACDCDGLPHVSMNRLGDFCDTLHAQARGLKSEDRPLPEWDDELYLELHRGTYTTQSWLKRANRRAESRLRVAEWLLCAGPTAPTAPDRTATAERLDEAWQLVLLNQFHDIITGASIAAVYDDARTQYERIERICDDAINIGLARWSDAIDTGDAAEPMIVFNPTSTPCSSIVECNGTLHHVEDVPPMGCRVVDRVARPVVESVQVDEATLSNGVIRVSIDEVGRITSLRRLDADRDACGSHSAGDGSRLNQLVLYEDLPRAWEAWDIDEEYLEKPRPITTPVESRRVVVSEPLRGVIEVTRELGRHSRLTQRFTLDAGSPRLDIHTHIDWREERTLLRALFPVDVDAREATYEIQFGHIQRPSHRETSQAAAKFEVCAHGWMDLSEPGLGVALLNDCKYGHSCHGNVIGLTLLRSPNFPDPAADRGEHEFTYSLMPHGGDWRAAGVKAASQALNNPLLVRSLPPAHTGTVSGAWSPFTIECDGEASPRVAAIKPAEDGDRVIIRLVETHGRAGAARVRWNWPVTSVTPVNLLEEPMALPEFNHDASTDLTSFAVQPFQIVTLAVARGG